MRNGFLIYWESARMVLGEGGAGADVRFDEAGVVGEEVEDEGDPDAMASDAGFAEADVGVDGDAGEDFGLGHEGMALG